VGSMEFDSLPLKEEKSYKMNDLLIRLLHFLKKYYHFCPYHFRKMDVSGLMRQIFSFSRLFLKATSVNPSNSLRAMCQGF